MYKLFVPYKDKKPAVVEVKGHKVIILTTERSSMEDDMALVGGETCRSINLEGTTRQQMLSLRKLSDRSGAGIVVNAGSVDLSDVIKNLEAELPWLQ